MTLPRAPLALDDSASPALVGRPRPSKWRVLAAVAIGVFMANLDASVVNVSLPLIARSFGVSVIGPIEWVVIAYLLTIAAVLLTAGRLADTIGRVPVWLGGAGAPHGELGPLRLRSCARHPHRRTRAAGAGWRPPDGGRPGNPDSSLPAR